jgi:hypothetical protein
MSISTKRRKQHISIKMHIKWFAQSLARPQRLSPFIVTFKRRILRGDVEQLNKGLHLARDKKLNTDILSSCVGVTVKKRERV